MERETKTFKAGDNEVVILAYLTGREHREFQGVATKAATLEKGEVVQKDFNISVVNEAHDWLVKNLVKSINGSTENILNTILDLRSDECNAIMAELLAIATVEKKSLA